MEIIKTFIVQEHIDSTDPKHSKILSKVYLLENGTYIRESLGMLQEITKKEFEEYTYW